MTKFDYAQSNSLLQKEIDGATLPTGNAPSLPPSKRIPRWQLDDSTNGNANPVDVTDGILSASKKIPHANPSVINNIAAAVTVETSAMTAIPPVAVCDGADITNPSFPATGAFKNKTAAEKRKSKPVPAKKSSHSKHKLTATATATTTTTTTNIKTEAEINATENENSEKKQKKTRSRKPRRMIPNEKEYIPEDEQPTLQDIIGGRGGRSNHHPGNRPYWMRILESRIEYTNCRSDLDKSQIAHGILIYVRQSLGGRFLNIDSKTKRWFILPDTVVLDKIKQALRDKYVPFWARTLKIEDKVHSNITSIMTARAAMNGNRGSNNISGNIFNSAAAWGTARAGMNNGNTIPSPAARMAAFNASQAANTLNAAEMVNNPTASDKNQLEFLFNSAAARKPAQSHLIPTIDDLLKRKVDQLPLFRVATATTTPPNIAAAAFANSPALQSTIGLNAFQTKFRQQWMASMGIPTSIGSIGSISTNPANNGATGDANHGFGAGGNPGAPSLPTITTGAFPSSIGLLQSLDMKSLDSYMEQQATGTAAPNAQNPKTIDMLKAVVGSSISSAVSASTMGTITTSISKSPTAGITAGTSVAAPNASNKTDWDAMFTKALSKP